MTKITKEVTIADAPFHCNAEQAANWVRKQNAKLKARLSPPKAELQGALTLIKRQITKLEERYFVIDNSCRGIFSRCDPDNPSSVLSFVKLNNMRDKRRKLKSDIKSLAAVAKLIKQELRK